jgi:ABC-type phosphate/phosphonate transport system substrate-binding protein
MKPWGHIRVLSSLIVAASIAAISTTAGEAQDSSVIQIRMAASTSLSAAEVNINDARAAIGIWTESFSRERGVRILYPPEVMSTPEQMFQKIRQGQLDVFSFTTPEYVRARAYTDPGLLLVDQSYVTGGEEYLILVHADSGIRSLADLRKHTLVRHDAPIMCLASDWLATFLASSGLGSPESFFSQISSVTKVSRAILPVFFRQFDACLVTRRAFETMAEMNPQLSAKLRILARSPKLVPVVVAFHKNCSVQQKEKFKSALIGLGTTTAGRQILNLFGSRQIMASDESILGSAIEIITASSRIRAHAAAEK